MPGAACPVCESRARSTVIELGAVPALCNVFWSTRELAREAARGPVELELCGDCGMMWNSAYDPSIVPYDGEFENSLHFSPTFQDYAERLVRRLVERYDVRGKDVIDIGCGKGDFLRMMCAAGSNRGVGFDPAYDGPDADTEGIRFVRDLYSPGYADVAGDLVTCRHVLEHVVRPRDFMSSVRRAMGTRPGAILYVEVPAGEYMLESVGVWDVIYEHCSFFTAPALTRLLEESGFQVLDVGTDYGGQYLWAEASVAERRVDARANGVGDLVDLAQRFATRAEARVSSADELLREREGRVVALWGAGSKGVTFLNIVPSAREVELAVDVNPRKHGQHVAGTGQPVVAPEDLAEHSVDAVLVTNPLYRDEVAVRLAGLGSRAEVLVV